MDIKTPSPEELHKIALAVILAAAVIGAVLAIAEIVSEQSALREQMQRVEVGSAEIAALIAEANGIARKAAE